MDRGFLRLRLFISIKSLILLFAAYASPVGKKSSFEFLPLAGECVPIVLVSVGNDGFFCNFRF